MTNNIPPNEPPRVPQKPIEQSKAYRDTLAEKLGITPQRLEEMEKLAKATLLDKDKYKTK